MLLSNRRHQLNYEQALQSYRPVFSGSIQYILSGHPMFGETAIINCFFQNMSLYNSIIYIMRGSRRPVNFMTKLQIHWPMQCQWNTERVSHFHQGSQHWESWNSHHHRGKTRGAYQATALDDLGVSPQRQDTERMSSYRFRYNNASPCNVSGTRSAYPTFTMVANIRSPGTPLGHHHRGKTRGACQATALDIPLPAHAMPVEQGALVPPPPG